MPDFRVRFNKPAFVNLESISQYIAKDSPQNAADVANAIVTMIDSSASRLNLARRSAHVRLRDSA